MRFGPLDRILFVLAEVVNPAQDLEIASIIRAAVHQRANVIQVKFIRPFLAADRIGTLWHLAPMALLFPEILHVLGTVRSGRAAGSQT